MSEGSVESVTTTPPPEPAAVEATAPAAAVVEASAVAPEAAPPSAEVEPAGASAPQPESEPEILEAPHRIDAEAEADVRERLSAVEAELATERAAREHDAAEVARLRDESRRRVLSDAGVRPECVKFVPADIDTTTDAGRRQLDEFLRDHPTLVVQRAAEPERREFNLPEGRDRSWTGRTADQIRRYIDTGSYH